MSQDELKQKIMSLEDGEVFNYKPDYLFEFDYKKLNEIDVTNLIAFEKSELTGSRCRFCSTKLYYIQRLGFYLCEKCTLAIYQYEYF